MDREEPFIVGEIYHVYAGGVEKRNIFTCEADYERFVALLLFSNSGKPVRLGNLRAKHKGKSPIEILGRVLPEYTRVDILAYSLMPNHMHLILYEKVEKGISAFMHKLMTSYSMYFNVRYARSGPLFARPFRSKHIPNEEYLRWLFAYVHLTPLTLAYANWKEKALDQKTARQFMQEYRFSSFHDFLYGERLQSIVLSKSAWPIDLGRFRAFDDLLAEFSSYHPEYRGESLL
jgi:REP element-mobilizing transposase RayT